MIASKRIVILYVFLLGMLNDYRLIDHLNSKQSSELKITGCQNFEVVPTSPAQAV